MAPHLKEVGLALFFFLSSTFALDQAPQNQPRLRSNATLNVSRLSSINTRDLFGLDSRDYYECPVGYSECSDNTSTCCALGKSCCSKTDYCADPGDTCCAVGTCPSGWNCCGNEGYCSPVGGECCEGGYYCNVGYQCKVWDGEDVCCPDTGCVGSDGTGDYGTTVSAVGSATETDTYMTTSTSSYTYHYTYDEYSYYYTTYYWTFWFYFWTSYSPYTVQTVTSTETTETTVWSIYASNSAMASRSFEYSAEIFTQSIPYSATYLESSTDAVPIKTGSNGTPTATAMNGGDIPHQDAAASVTVNRWVPWACALFGGLTGALAFGL